MISDPLTCDLLKTFEKRFIGKTLPFLAEQGWDKSYGGIIERLDANGSPTKENYRRVMVHARQLYVFAIWGTQIGETKYKELADDIFSYMIKYFWDEKNGGWFTKVSLDGEVTDSNKTLYSHAFVLFGLTKYFKALDRTEAIPWIVKSFEVIKQRFKRDDKSFSEELTADFVDISTNRRSQNPHMHLFESLLSLSETLDNKTYCAQLLELLTLCQGKFLDFDRSLVLEHLDETFCSRVDIGHLVEPGHHFEWSWLLNWYSLVFNDPRQREKGKALLKFGCQFGWDQDLMGVFDQINIYDLSASLHTKRLWPLLELIKSLTVFPDVDLTPSLATSMELLLEKYLLPNGHWIEKYNSDWSVADSTMPLSSGYHITMALQELKHQNFTKKFI